MGLPKLSTKRFFRGSWGTVAYVDDQLVRLKPGFALTTIITREPSGGFSVRTAIVESSGDTVPLTESEYSKLLLIT